MKLKMNKFKKRKVRENVKMKIDGKQKCPENEIK